MSQINDNSNCIGNILYELVEDNMLNIIETNSTFKLRKAKISHKSWNQSKIFATEEKSYYIYIEELDKWYYNSDMFKDEDITVETYDSIDEIQVNQEENTSKEEDILPDHLLFSGYLIYNIINHNYISCREYKSRLLLEKEDVAYNKTHIAELYKHENIENVYFIKGFDKWYYNSRDYYSKFLDIKLYDSFEKIPLEELIKKEQEEVHRVHSNTEDENREFRRSDITRLNINKIHKDLSKLGYMLFEFSSVNHITYKIFETSEEAEEYFTDSNQITKCFCKKNDENIIFIKFLHRWVNKLDETGKLYETDTDIPVTTLKEEVQESESETKNLLKELVKLRKLVPMGWLYYEIIDDKQIKCQKYNSSNQLLTRLEDGGNDSIIFKSKLENVCYITKLDKWFYYTEELENDDVKIKIYEEKEVFEE